MCMQMLDHNGLTVSVVIDGDDIMGVDAERTIQSIHTKFVCLTHRVPMVQFEDLPEAMQHQVVGVPRAWVQLIR